MLVVATRFWDQDDSLQIKRIISFVKEASGYAPHVLVAVKEKTDVTNAVEVINDLRIPGVEAFPIIPWGKYTTALNHLLLKAAALDAKQILFASAEIRITKDIVGALLVEADRDVLVVGPLLPGHSKFRKGSSLVNGTGACVPWNTCALWNLKQICRAGFPLIADMPFEQEKAGAEEAITIALLQIIDPSLKAVLKSIPGISFDYAGWSEERHRRHNQNIRTKSDRTYNQIISLGSLAGGALRYGKVLVKS